MTSPADQTTDVLVVGAGPVGLFAASALCRHGVRVRIIDKYRRAALHSYALALHPDTLRLLDELGLARELIARGQTIKKIGIYQGSDRVSEVDLSRLGDPFAFALVLPQTNLEAALESRLRENGVDVLWHHEALNLEVRPEGVDALVAHKDELALGYPDSQLEWLDGGSFGIASRFVIGADGYGSAVRQTAGIDYADLEQGESYCLFELETDQWLDNEMCLVAGDEGFDVLWPLGQKRGRWSFRVDDPGTEPPTLDDLHALLRARAPWFDGTSAEIRWSTTVRFERRLVDRFGAGRIWLAGDAAHLTGPVGVQTMNISFREVNDLAARMATILTGPATVESLADYDAERRAEWRRLFGLDGAIQADESTPSWARERADQLVTCLPASGDALGQLLSQLGLAYLGN